MPASSLVVLGRLTKPHGVKGEIRVDYYADSADLLEKPLMLRAGRFAPRPVRIREWHLWKDQLILSIEGCNDRSKAEQLRGQELLIDASFLPEAEEDEPYLRDLIGLSVRLEDGTVVGELENVDFPAVPEFVRDIDLTAETATIAPPEGLLDLYREGAAADLPDDGQEEEDAASSSKA